MKLAVVPATKANGMPTMAFVNSATGEILEGVYDYKIHPGDQGMIVRIEMQIDEPYKQRIKDATTIKGIPG